MVSVPQGLARSPRRSSGCWITAEGARHGSEASKVQSEYNWTRIVDGIEASIINMFPP
jgi:hypothetical protein